MTKIIVYSSDTDLTPFDTGAYASSTTYVSGNAVKCSAEEMKGMLKAEAAIVLEVEEKDVVYEGMHLRTKDGSREITLAELGNILYYNENQKQLVATGSYVGTKSPPPFMAGFAEVEVDTQTGKVELVDYTAVVDCGTPLNPSLAKGQMTGGLVQGIGMAMYEEVIVNEKGKMLTNSFMNYRIPTRKEIRHLQVEFADSYEESGPYGAKSVGEIGIDTPPAAIANAVFNAVGVRINELPITAEKVLTELLKSKKL